MASQKPTFIFFKMLNCGHCVQFAEKPTPETSPWAELLRDKELQAAVNFVRYDWGTEKAANGGIVQHKLPEQYKFVNYGPYFYMHNASSVNNGLEFKDSGPRTPANMKKWILENLRKDPQLSASRRVEATPLPVPPTPSPVQNQRPTMFSPNNQVQGFSQGQQTKQMVQPPRIQPPAPMMPQAVAPQPQGVPQPVATQPQKQPARIAGKAVKVSAQPQTPLNLISRNRRKH